MKRAIRTLLLALPVVLAAAVSCTESLPEVNPGSEDKDAVYLKIGSVTTSELTRAAIEVQVNDVISASQPVTIEYMSREEASKVVDLSKLPEDASETLRIVRIGDYDACACIGAHVANTSEIGTFKILSHDFNDGVWRLRWKIIRDED